MIIYSSVTAVASLCAVPPSLSREGFLYGKQSPQSPIGDGSPLVKGSLFIGIDFSTSLRSARNDNVMWRFDTTLRAAAFALYAW